MRLMTIQYRKWGILHRIHREIPASWNELNAAQFVAIVSLNQRRIDEYQFFHIFFGLNRTAMERIDPFQLYSLSETLGFLSDQQVWHTDFFLSQVGKLRAPGRMLSGMSFHQFITADTYYSWYAATENAIYIDKFVAALYLRQGESFIPGEGVVPDMERRLQEVKRIDLTTKMAILLNWSLIKMWLARTFTSLFPPSADTTGKPKPSEWLTLFDAFVGDHIADIDAYKALPCMDAFRILNRRIREAKR